MTQDSQAFDPNVPIPLDDADLDLAVADMAVLTGFLHDLRVEGYLDERVEKRFGSSLMIAAACIMRDLHDAPVYPTAEDIAQAFTSTLRTTVDIEWGGDKDEHADDAPVSGSSAEGEAPQA